MRVDDFDFELPRERIAERPASPRDSARLLHVEAGGLADLGVAVQRKSTTEFSDFVAKQVADWGPAVKASGAKLN